MTRYVAYAAAGAALAAFTACAAGSTRSALGAGGGSNNATTASSSGSTGTSSNTASGGSSSSSSTSTTTSTSASSSGAGGSAPMGDAIPASAVSFFQGPACPTGWSIYMPADGRFVVPTVANAPGGTTVGTPLTPGEDRKHTHPVSATFTLTSTSYVGVAGGGNGGVGPAGDLAFMTTSDPASTGLPYIQLLVCRKDVPAVAHAVPLPHGLQMFFDMSGCPAGWLQTSATQGRFIVGLPTGAPQDVTFGGAALSGLDGGTAPTNHTHGNTATLTTTSHGIALASGCCGDGYAANATVMSTMDTGSADTGLPFIELLSCEKQ